MPGTHNSPFRAMKVRGPLAQAGFEKVHGVDFEEENLCCDHQDWECKVREVKLLLVYTGRKLWTDNSGREGPREQVGAWGLGR